MLNYIKFIEILISLQSIFIATMIPVFISIPLSNNFKYNIEIPITWQIPTIILLSLILNKKVVFKAFTIYLFLGLFIIPIFHQGGSLGYILTPNFGYLIGIYPLILKIDNFKKKNIINIFEFLKYGIIGIATMHTIGIIYNCLQIIYYRDMDFILYNLGFYSLGKIGYHFLMLVPISFLLKPIYKLKYKK